MTASRYCSSNQRPCSSTVLRTVNDHRAHVVARPFDLRPPSEFCLAAQIGAGCTGAARKHRPRTRPVLSSTRA